jgi:hypothetical protein
MAATALEPPGDQSQQQASDACRDCWQEPARADDGRCDDCHGEAVMRW